MASFYFVFIAVLLSGLGGRDMALVAGMSAAQGRRRSLLLLALATAALTAIAAAWAATAITPLLAPRARVFFAAMALLFAGLEALLVAPRARPSEPTHSLGAFVIVLATTQLLDAARFLIFAIAVATNAPAPAGIGGAVAGCVLVAAAWAFPDIARRPAVRQWRRAIGALLLIGGALLALDTLELIRR